MVMMTVPVPVSFAFKVSCSSECVVCNTAWQHFCHKVLVVHTPQNSQDSRWRMPLSVHSLRSAASSHGSTPCAPRRCNTRVNSESPKRYGCCCWVSKGRSCCCFCMFASLRWQQQGKMTACWHSKTHACVVCRRQSWTTTTSCGTCHIHRYTHTHGTSP